MLTRQTIADQFGININYLSEIFKRDTKLTVLKFIEFEKITRSKNLLIDRRDLNIEEISRLIGIQKVNQYREKFKRYYYITPGEYRNSLKNRETGTTE